MGLAARLQTAHTPDFVSDRRSGPDPVLLTVAALIITIGVVMVTSAGYIIATGRFGDSFYYTKKQLLALVLGLSVMYGMSVINPAFWRRVVPYLMIVGLVLLLLVFVPGLGVEMGGSKRWIRLPFGLFLQPSEFVKYALVLFLAASLAKKGEGIKDLAVGFLPNILVVGAVVGLVLAQPDFGTAVIITVVGFLMLFVAGVKPRHLLASLVICSPVLVYWAFQAPYRISRLKAFVDPWRDPLDAGFQVIQSLVAFGCGGLWGVGVGKGIQKLYYLPQPHTDFIFSVLGEETGLVGVVALILLFYILICRGFVVAIRARDSFHQYLAFGIICLIGLQAMINMGVSMGMLPTKGLPLPFVSLGGTSLVMNLAGLGMLLSIARHEATNSRGAAS